MNTVRRPATQKNFRAAIERTSDALIMGADLKPADLRVALVMLRMSNAQRFAREGLLISWLSEDSLARCARLTPGAVRRARARLRALGVISYVEAGGLRPGHTSTFAFNEDWADRTEALLKETGIADILTGKRDSADHPKEPAAMGNAEQAKSGSAPTNGAQPPPPPDDPQAALWNFGISLLGAASIPQQRARSMIGKWRKSLGASVEGDIKLLGILMQCQRAHVVDPAAWIAKAVNETIRPRNQAGLW